MNNDLISREALKEAIDDYAEKRQDTLLWQSDIEEIIDNAPAVDTTCPHCDSGYAQGYSDGYLQGHVEGYLKAEKDYAKPLGEWLFYRCSNCGTGFNKDINLDKYNFCPNCGANMKGGAE